MWPLAAEPVYKKGFPEPLELREGLVFSAASAACGRDVMKRCRSCDFLNGRVSTSPSYSHKFTMGGSSHSAWTGF